MGYHILFLDDSAVHCVHADVWRRRSHRVYIHQEPRSKARGFHVCGLYPKG